MRPSVSSLSLALAPIRRLTVAQYGEVTVTLRGRMVGSIVVETLFR